MENRQTNFFKSKDFIDNIKPIEKGIEIDTYENIENQILMSLFFYIEMRIQM